MLKNLDMADYMEMMYANEEETIDKADLEDTFYRWTIEATLEQNYSLDFLREWVGCVSPEEWAYFETLYYAEHFQEE